MKLFTPPIYQVPSPTNQRFWDRTHDLISHSILEVSLGQFREVSDPSDEEVRDAVTALLGGRTYLVTDDLAARLTTAGYGQYLSNLPVAQGYGHGRYGKGTYGAGDQSLTSGRPYGSGPYGYDVYG